MSRPGEPPRRAFVAGLFHETNSFSPIPTNRASFDAHGYRPAGVFEMPRDVDTMGYGHFASVCLQEGLEVRGGRCAIAQPSAPLAAREYAALRDEILADLRRALPVDLVFLFMHGAQVAEGCDDVEGELIGAVRDLVGEGVPIGVELDLHGNVTPAMLEQADVVVACLEYPHVDYAIRARTVFDVLAATARGAVRPVTVAWRVPIVGAYPTLEGPMQEYVARLRAVEREPRVLAASAFHGFWLADTPWSAGCVVVTTDGDEALAAERGRELAARLIEVVGPTRPGLGVREAVDEALAGGRHPVVIADRGDNPGGGAAGDSTFLLRELLARGVRDCAVAMLWDPVAADFAHRAGVGARLGLRLGGKISLFSGDPLDVEATVTCVRDDARQAFFGAGPPRAALGRSAALRIDGVHVVVNSERQQVFDPRCFSEHGIDPAAQRILVVKSTAHFRNAFAPLAAQIIDCESPGSLTMDVAALPYRRIPRPLFPLDRDFDMQPTLLYAPRSPGASLPQARRNGDSRRLDLQPEPRP